jgi:hypothetical protein
LNNADLVDNLQAWASYFNGLGAPASLISSADVSSLVGDLIDEGGEDGLPLPAVPFPITVPGMSSPILTLMNAMDESGITTGENMIQSMVNFLRQTVDETPIII